jgi:hypothetical protein
MGMMTKEEARLFKERWRAVNEITIEEARRKTVSERLLELEVLYEFGQALGWANRDDCSEVRARWNRLKEKVGA